MHNGGKWSEARYRGFIISALRAASRRWPPKFEVLKEAKTEKKVNKKTKRLAQHFLCAACQKEFTATNVQVDHIEPIIPPHTGFTTWDDFIKRLYCEKSNLQVLCKGCHLIKTKKEKDASTQRTRT